MDKREERKNHKMNWETISSKSSFKDRWISVRSDVYKMPSGTIIDPYHILEYNDWVHIIAFNENNEILVTEQYRPGIKKMSLEFPCGSMEKDEDPKEAAIRELKEETGYSFSLVYEIGSPATNPATHTNYIHVFIAEGDYTVSNQMLDKTEDIGYRFMSLCEINEHIRNGNFPQSYCLAGLYLAVLSKRI